MTNLVKLLNETLEADGEFQEEMKYIFVREVETRGYGTIGDVTNALNNGWFAPMTGAIVSLINSNTQTEFIFRNNFDDIFELINEYDSEYGETPQIEYNANNLVWFGFEYLCNKWNYQLEDMEEI